MVGHVTGLSFFGSCLQCQRSRAVKSFKFLFGQGNFRVSFGQGSFIGVSLVQEMSASVFKFKGKSGGQGFEQLLNDPHVQRVNGTSTFFQRFCSVLSYFSYNDQDAHRSSFGFLEQLFSSFRAWICVMV